MSTPVVLYHNPQFRVETLNGIDCTCDLRIIRNDRDQVIVIASEIIARNGDYTEGVSVTNAAQDLATNVLPMGYTFDWWIEHYTRRGSEYSPMKEEFSIVTMQARHQYVRYGFERLFAEPEWRHVTREEIEHLAGDILIIPETCYPDSGDED